MSTMRVGEIGKVFRLSTGFDMSGNNALTLNFTKPNGTDTLQKTQASSNAVTAPAVALVNDPDLGNVPASTYFQFTTVAADFDVGGTWEVCGIYFSATQEYHSATATVVVEDACA